MIDSIVTLAVGVLFFCVIIMVHELGHFTAAKLFKMRVYEFSMGMGPVIFKKVKNGTQYSLKAVPFGGSVQLGEDMEDNSPDAFRNKPVWQKMIVILAGAVMNLLLGLIICIIISCMIKLVPTTEILSFREDAVSNISLREGDTIVAVNGSKIFTFDEFLFKIYNNESKSNASENEAVFDITVMRDGQKTVINDVAFSAQTNENGGKSIYFDFYILGEKKSISNVIDYSIKNTISMSRIVLMSLGDLLQGKYKLNDLSGPVGVVSEIQSAAKADIEIDRILSLFALITVNVGIFNLLPIPALDGARFFFFLIEAVRRKPLKAEVEGMVHFVGFAALMLLMIVVTISDVLKIFDR